MKRTCTKCKKSKPLTEFYIIHKGTYLMGECKECNKERVKTYNKIPKVRERKTELQRKFMQENRKIWNKWSRDYTKKNRIKVNLSVTLRAYLKRAKENGISVSLEKNKYRTLSKEILKERIFNIRKLLSEKGVKTNKLKNKYLLKN